MSVKDKAKEVIAHKKYCDTKGEYFWGAGERDEIAQALLDAIEVIETINGVMYTHIGCAVHNRLSREFLEKINE